MQSKTLSQLSEYVGGHVHGDPNVIIKSASTLSRAVEGDISFLVNRRNKGQLKKTRASAVIVDTEDFDSSVPMLVTEDPYYAFMQIMVLLRGHEPDKKEAGISKNASICDTAKIGANCSVGDFVTIEDQAQIGNGTVIYPGVYIGRSVQIGSECVIFPNVSIYDGCRIGKRVIINSNTAIGPDGFSYASHKGKHRKIPQVGAVSIEDDVEIGSCCVVERGTLGDTVIGRGTKIGDLVVVGHGSKVGAHCLIVAQAGLSGSNSLGHHCVVGGQVAVVSHIEIGNNVTVAAQSGVVNNISDGQIVLGSPAVEANRAKQAYNLIQYLPDIIQDIQNIKDLLGQQSCEPEKYPARKD